jgi:hypothetical protein
VIASDSVFENSTNKKGLKIILNSFHYFFLGIFLFKLFFGRILKNFINLKNFKHILNVKHVQGKFFKTLFEMERNSKK